MMCLSFSVTTVFKFYVLAKRSIPEMDESYVSKVVMALITLISWSVSCIKFLGRDTKPTYNQVNVKITFCGIHNFILGALLI